VTRFLPIRAPGVSSWRWVVALTVVCGGAGCRERAHQGDEGSKVKEAVEKFIDFGMSNERYDHGKQVERLPPAKVRSRRVDNTMSPRLRLDLEIELPYDLRGAALERAMLESARRALAGTPYQAVRVRAWPGPLKRFGGTMGYAVVAVDGHGWDGERLGYREARSLLADTAARPNALDYKILCALELEAEKLAGSKAKPAAQRKQAEAAVAKALGLQLEAVRNAVAKADQYYLKE
jgi:hypothetical protein